MCTCSSTGPPISLLISRYFLTVVAIRVSKSSIICGIGSATALGAGGFEVAMGGPAAAGAVTAGTLPFVFGTSITDDAISSSREVAASSLRTIDVSATLVTMTGHGSSSMVTAQL